MPDYFRILELEPGASQQEIKKAYFRLIREHSPDKDPEGFMKIREAYEQLKAGNTANTGPSFSVPSDPVVSLVRSSVEEALMRKDFEKVMELCEFGVKQFPKEPYFLYYLQIAQRRLGYTGKAVKTGEKLYALDRNNPFFCKELTISYLERGWVKKAMNQFQFAWALGVRDAEFVAMMVAVAEDKDYLSFAYRVLILYLREKKEWSKDEMEAAKSLYSILIYMASEKSGSAEEPYRLSLDFMKRYFSLLGSDQESLLSMLALTSFTAEISDDLRKEIIAFADSNRYLMSPVFLEAFDISKKHVQYLKVIHDPMFSEEIKHLTVLEKSDFKDVNLYDYTRLDLMLIMMKRKETAREILFLKFRCPEAYEKYREFYDSFNDPKLLEKKMNEYRVQFRRLSAEYTGADFYKLYPDEKNRSLPEALLRDFAASSNRRKYGRALAGRNDPCPCGSGKKFKKCCMGKGIFD